MFTPVRVELWEKLADNVQGMMPNSIARSARKAFIRLPN
jgi:hypothetical protein